MGRRSGLRLLALAVALSAGALLPASALAHPLGNFTINHYAGLTIAADHIELDVVIDMAEIPTFQERQAMDADGDGSVADEEAAAYAGRACATLAGDLRLSRGSGASLDLVPGARSIAFPAGAGGLSTLRLECAYRAELSPPLGSEPATLHFADSSYAERIGWREIVATGPGLIVDTHGLPATSPSAKLTAYPADLIRTPLDIRSATIDARLDPAAPPATASAAPPTTAPPAAGGPIASAGPGPGAVVPGGVAAELPDIFRTADLTPIVILASLLTAVLIGAGHALTPGHGKTLMAAYLVGSRGTAVHAVGLGLSVAVSHTLGIFALALIIVGAGSVLPPDVVYRVTPVIAGASIVAIGGWMLISEVRRRRRRHAADLPHGHGHDLEHEHASTHVHGDSDAHEHGHDHAAAHAHAAPEPEAETATEHGHGHEHEHEHEHASTHVHDDSDAHEHGHDHAAAHAHAAPEPEAETATEHSHGGVRHSHLPPGGTTLTWRGLFVLGLAGGLIPSTSALLILLGSIAAGRPAFGLILVVAFGLGMAAVMTGVGLAMIVARTRLDRMPSRSSLGRLAAVAPLVASVAVLGLGIVLTWQAVSGSPVL